MARFGFRFSLRVLVYAALLVASIMWLVNTWPAWFVERTFGGHTKHIRALAFSPDGRRLFAGGEDGALHSISLDDGTRWIAAAANPDTIHTISVSPDSTRVFAGGSQRTGSMWEAATGKKLFTLEKLPGEILASAYAPDGSFFVTGSGAASPDSKGVLRIWNAKDGALRTTIEAHEKGITGISISPDGALIYSGSADATVRVWDVEAAAEIQKLTENNPIDSLALSADGTKLAYSSMFRYRVTDTSLRVNTTLVMTSRIKSRRHSWSGDSKQLLSENSNRTLEIRDYNNDQHDSRIVWPEVTPGCSAFSPDGKNIAFLINPNTLGLLTNRRPEAWYGIFYLPAFWITLLVAAALVRTIVADRKALFETSAAVAGKV